MRDQTSKTDRRRPVNTCEQFSTPPYRHRFPAARILGDVQDHAEPLGEALRLSIANPNRMKVLRAIASSPGGVTYSALLDAVDVTYRRMQDFTRFLRELGLITTEGNPALITFASDSIRRAVTELLTVFDSEWAEAVVGGKPGSIFSLMTGDEEFDTYLERFLKSLAGMLRPPPT